MIVIGRYRFYIDEAKRLRGEVFSLPKDEWDAMTPDQQWALNKEFLDKAIAANDQIWVNVRSCEGAPRLRSGKGIDLSGQPWLVPEAGRRSLGGRTVLELGASL